MSETTSVSSGAGSNGVRSQSADRARQASIEERNRSTSEGGKIMKDFVASVGITSAQAEVLLKQYGRNELEDKQKPKVIINELIYLL